MTSAAYVLTYRGNNDPHRRANLDAVLDWLAPMTQIEVVVVEQDVLPTLPRELPHPRCRVVFAYNPGPFNKSWGLNVGFRLTQSALLGFGDADIITGETLPRAYQLLGQGMQAAKPYRRLIDLSPEETRLVLDGAVDQVPHRSETGGRNREDIGERIVFAGGSFVIRREAFVALGGWDERFRGWGGEDDALSYRIERSGLACTEIDIGPALHLWHPRAATFGQPYYEDNLRLLDEYPKYADAQLSRLAQVQMQLIGNIGKYRPLNA